MVNKIKWINKRKICMQKTEDEYHRNERTQNCANRAPRKERWPSRRRLYRYETVNMKTWKWHGLPNLPCMRTVCIWIHKKHRSSLSKRMWWAVDERKKQKCKVNRCMQSEWIVNREEYLGDVCSEFECEFALCFGDGANTGAQSLCPLLFAACSTHSTHSTHPYYSCIALCCGHSG